MSSSIDELSPELCAWGGLGVAKVTQIIVDRQGNVASVRVVKPVGLGLDENTVNIIRTRKFHPATRQGVPVAVKLLVKTDFRLF
jgi:TonB family protein